MFVSKGFGKEGISRKFVGQDSLGKQNTLAGRNLLWDATSRGTFQELNDASVKEVGG